MVFVPPVDMIPTKMKEAGVCMGTEQKVKVGMTVSYWDMANPYHEGVIVEINSTSNDKYLLFGSNSNVMERIYEEATVVWPDSWHKSNVAVNSLHYHDHAGFRLEDKPLVSKEEVEKLVAEYERMQPILAEERRKSAEEKEKEQERKKEQYKNEYSYLTKQEDSKLSSYALGAKNLKVELNRAFPNTKFSVKSEGYSMGDNIDVFWENGPSRTEIEKYANKYKEGWFDGMEDLYHYSDGVWWEVFGGAKYVFCNREITEDVATKVAEGFSEYNGNKFNGDLNAEVDPSEPFRTLGRWRDCVSHFVDDKNLTNFNGVEKVDCTCGQWPNDFFRMKED